MKFSSQDEKLCNEMENQSCHEKWEKICHTIEKINCFTEKISFNGVTTDKISCQNRKAH